MLLYLQTVVDYSNHEPPLVLYCDIATQERIVQAGAVPAIIALSVGEEVQVASQRRCAAALCNFACAPANIARMVEVFRKK